MYLTYSIYNVETPDNGFSFLMISSRVDYHLVLFG